MRRNRLFQGTTKTQRYLALFFGMISSVYIWLPIAKELESQKRRRTKEGNAESCPNNTGKNVNKTMLNQ